MKWNDEKGQKKAPSREEHKKAWYVYVIKNKQKHDIPIVRWTSSNPLNHYNFNMKKESEFKSTVRLAYHQKLYSYYEMNLIPRSPKHYNFRT